MIVYIIRGHFFRPLSSTQKQKTEVALLFCMSLFLNDCFKERMPHFVKYLVRLLFVSLPTGFSGGRDYTRTPDKEGNQGFAK